MFSDEVHLLANDTITEKKNELLHSFANFLNTQRVLPQLICTLAGYFNVLKQSFLKAEGSVWIARHRPRSGRLYFFPIILSV